MKIFQNTFNCCWF